MPLGATALLAGTATLLWLGWRSETLPQPTVPSEAAVPLAGVLLVAAVLTPVVVVWRRRRTQYLRDVAATTALRQEEGTPFLQLMVDEVEARRPAVEAPVPGSAVPQ